MSKPRILAVDDEEFNLDIINEYLSSAGFEVICAEDGDEALMRMEEYDNIVVIVLDRMMPKMNGMEVVRALKQDNRFKDIPIVMQTAAAQTEQVIEGINQGVYYYLSKPYQEDLFVSIVKAACAESLTIRELKTELEKITNLPSLLKSGTFAFRTITEAKTLAAFLGKCFPNPEDASANLISLLTNAVYANIGIDYAHKTRLLLEGRLDDEVNRLLNKEDYKHKRAHVSIAVNPRTIVVNIKDQGFGFDWKKYLNFSADYAHNPNGRGIVKAKLYFSSLEYLGNGSEVLCTKVIEENFF